MRWILASQSPRRRELMALLGVTFTVHAVPCDETVPPGTPPEEAVALLAEKKARACAAEMGPGCWILGADTLVVQRGRLLGKPRDGAEARAMLRSLSDDWHEVMTGLALIAPGGTLYRATEVTRVHFAPLTEEEIAAYVATGDPMDKAGAYGIQSGAAPFADRIEGCYYNVVGLPLARLRKLMARAAEKEADSE